VSRRFSHVQAVLVLALGCGSADSDAGYFAGVARVDGPFAERTGAVGRVEAAARYPFVALVLDEGRHHCSGTLIRADLVVTARHCLLPRERVSLAFPSNGVFRSASSLAAGSVLVEPKDVLAFDADVTGSSALPENDLAYITLREGVTQAIQGPLPAVSFGASTEGRALALVGFPDYAGAPPTRLESVNCSTTGRVSDQSPYGKALVETSCPATFGNSGGPIFAFSNGAPVLVGVVSHTFAVSAEDVDSIVPTGSDAFGKYVPANMSTLAKATRR
jgi:V8-like Glu-specific endopeptidase